MDVLREREVKDSLERQLQDEQKVRGEYRSRFYFVEFARGVPLQSCTVLGLPVYRFTEMPPNPFASFAFTALRKLTWPVQTHIHVNGQAVRAIRDTYDNLTCVHREPRADFRRLILADKSKSRREPHYALKSRLVFVRQFRVYRIILCWGSST